MPALRAAIDASLPELLPWIPWAKDEPSTLEELECRLVGYREDFEAGGDMLYAVIDPAHEQLLGGIGLYRRVGPGALEIGYWIRSDRVGEGLTTEAATAVTLIGLGLQGVERLEIHVDPANGASAAIPKNSVDVVFVCDTYHHFEYPEAMLASLHEALRPGGRLVVVDFERIPGETPDWVLEHVRAGKAVFRSEIEAAGFVLVREADIAGLSENYVLQFRRESRSP